MALNVANLNKLIAHLEAQPPERINMGWVTVEERPECGTAGCIVGHAQLIWPHLALEATGLSAWEINGPYDALVCPEGWAEELDGVRRYPAHRVISTLKRLRDRFLATGEIVVDWGPEPGEGQPWSAPQAVELKAPELPAEITRFLAVPSDTVEV